MKILEWIKYSGIKIQRRPHYTYESLEKHEEEIPLEDLPQEIVDAIYDDNNEDKK